MSGQPVNASDRVRHRGSQEGLSEFNMDTAEKVSEKEKEAMTTSTANTTTSTTQRLLAGVDMSILGAMVFNYLSSTGIVSANKFVMDGGFTFATSLTFLHFIFTTVGLLICAQINLYSPKKLDLAKAAKLSFFGMGFVVFSNLSLQYNSVGFYQVMKHMTVAAVVAIDALMYKKYLDRALWLPLGLVIAGVSLTGATDFRLNKIGTIFAVLNILCTSFYQIWCGALQKSLEANALQLQLYTAPMSALFIIPFIPILDNYSITSDSSIFHYEFTNKSLLAIAVTGVLAFGVNVSIFMVIGKTSAVTYNVLGHFKTCTLLMVDYIFFGRPFELKNFAGIVITLAGVVSYSQVKIMKSQQAASQTDKGAAK